MGLLGLSFPRRWARLAIGLISTIPLPAMLAQTSPASSGTAQPTASGDRSSPSQRRLTGVVKDGTGRPITFATVTATGGTAAGGAVRVDSEGRYAIPLPASAATILVRAIGFAAREIRVATDVHTLDVTLEPQALALGEITIVGSASDVARQRATTATASVSAEQVTRAPAQSIEQALQGKIVGASVNMNTGAPGGGGQIQIRGTTSILGNGEPLVIIDGVVSSNDAFSAGASTVTRGGTTQDQNVNRLADINPAEIESIEIVKDASATAVYGSRASNGVVVIRTKRGSAGAPRVTVRQSVGTSSPLRYLGARTYSNVSEVLALRYGATANAASQAYLASRFPSGTIPAEANIDLEREFFRSRQPSYETTLSLSGGNAATKYFASVTQRNEEGIAVNNAARLQSLRLNLDQTLSREVAVTFSLGVLRNFLQRGLANNDNSFTSPVYAFAYTPGVFDLRERTASGGYVRNPIFGGGFSASNPFETYEFLDYTQDVWRQIGSANLTYTPVQSERHRVVFGVLAGFDRYQQAGRLYSPGFLQYEGRNNLFGTSEQTTVDGLNYNLQPTASWTFAPSGVTFNTSVGGSLEQQSVNNYALIGRGLTPGSELASQGTLSASHAITRFRDQAAFVSEQVLAFDERLVLNTGLRADRSSANGDTERFFVFPRASAAYRFLSPVHGVDELKVRAGWGQTGNRPRFGDRNQTLDAGGIVQGQPSVQASSIIGNPDITPETLTEISGGLDLRALNGRLGFEGTLYRRTITDLLLQPPATPSSGYGTLVINAGALRNQGVELALTGTPVQTRSFSLDSRVTFQRKNELVTDLPESVPPFTPSSSFGASFGRNRITQGHQSSEIWGNVPVDANGQILPVGSYVTNPAAIVARVDTVIGNSNPDFQMFFENTVRWGRVRLGVTADWRHGGDVANTTTKLYDEGGNSRDFTETITAGNVPRGTPASSLTNVPSTVLGLGDFRFRSWSGGSDARVYLQDGSYVRVREIALSLDAPERLARLLRASTLNVALRARNVLLFSDYWGYDPEFNNFGNQNVNRFIDTAPYPGARSFHLTFDLTY